MEKRVLDSTYKDLIEWINSKRHDLFLKDIIVYLSNPPKDLYDILYKMYGGAFKFNNALDVIIPVVSDIYLNNYELSDPKYYWKFNELTGRLAHDLYLSIRVGYPGTKLSDENCGLLDPEQYHIMKFTKSDINQYLIDNTNLDIDHFTPVESLED